MKSSSPPNFNFGLDTPASPRNLPAHRKITSWIAPSHILSFIPYFNLIFSLSGRLRRRVTFPRISDAESQTKKKVPDSIESTFSDPHLLLFTVGRTTVFNPQYRQSIYKATLTFPLPVALHSFSQPKTSVLRDHILFANNDHDGQFATRLSTRAQRISSLDEKRAGTLTYKPYSPAFGHQQEPFLSIPHSSALPKLPYDINFSSRRHTVATIIEFLWWSSS